MHDDHLTCSVIDPGILQVPQVSVAGSSGSEVLCVVSVEVNGHGDELGYDVEVTSLRGFLQEDLGLEVILLRFHYLNLLVRA